MNTKSLATEFTCPICLDLLRITMTTKACLHRFCNDCISKIFLTSEKESRQCPSCRTKLVSKRCLRRDTNFDELIQSIYPDRVKYDEMLAIADQEGDDVLTSIVSFVDEEEEKE
ncbi:hypothetical protein PFISCL1PPCAC_1352, partial [Pristionchus fissidentatus]